VAIANSERVVVESCEFFQKQTYRTRTHIYGEGGLLSLSIPVCRGASMQLPGSVADDTAKAKTHKLPVDTIVPEYSKGWVRQHKIAITSAYGLTPFFDYYRDYFFEILDSHPGTLLELNTRLLELCLKLIGLQRNVEFTEDFVAPGTVTLSNLLDLRYEIEPKGRGETLLEKWNMEREYWQVFSSKHGFIPNLSIIDLLFHEGPNTISFLR